MKTPMPTGQVVLRNVLYATDFSAASMRALPYAAYLARQYGAMLYASHVVPIESICWAILRQRNVCEWLGQRLHPI